MKPYNECTHFVVLNDLDKETWKVITNAEHCKIMNDALAANGDISSNTSMLQKEYFDINPSHIAPEMLDIIDFKNGITVQIDSSIGRFDIYNVTEKYFWDNNK